MTKLDEYLKLNCSGIFLLYPLGLIRQDLTKIGFKESYLKDENCEIVYQNPVFLLFETEKKDNLQLFVSNEYSRKNEISQKVQLVNDYNITENETVLVYEFPEELSDDYSKFIKGSYSKFSLKTKNSYPKFIISGKSKIVGTQYRIVTKDMDLEKILDDEFGQSFTITNKVLTLQEMLEERFGTNFTNDMELWKVPNIKKETILLRK